MKSGIYAVVLLILLSACQPVSWQNRFDHNENEIFNNDILSSGLSSEDITVFGVSLYDSTESVIKLHGEPTRRTDYGFGLIDNLEYAFTGDNETMVLYHTRNDQVEGILLTTKANPYLAGLTVMNHSQYDLYSIFGQPTLIDRKSMQRRIVWDVYGIEVFVDKGSISSIYFTKSNTGLEPIGEDIECDDETEQAAIQDDTQECLVFPSRCLVPDDWDYVPSCDSNEKSNSAPIICIQVITPGFNPDTNECKEFPSPCDLPSGWEKVDKCEDI